MYFYSLETLFPWIFIITTTLPPSTITQFTKPIYVPWSFHWNLQQSILYY